MTWIDQTKKNLAKINDENCFNIIYLENYHTNICENKKKTEVKKINISGKLHIVMLLYRTNKHFCNLNFIDFSRIFKHALGGWWVCDVYCIIIINSSMWVVCILLSI